MAEEIENEEVSLTTGDNEIPALSFSETGYLGTLTLGGQIFEECSKELRWPQAGETYKKMAKDGAIAPALELVEMMIARVPWTVKIPEGYEEELAEKANFVRQCMNDMEHDFQSFIKQVVSFNRYGFCTIEKVYRYRRKDKGSKYDDGLVGIKKLPIRSQDSIDGWKWKNKGRELAGLYQNVIVPGQPEDYQGWDFVYGEETVRKFIPRKKFMLFRNNPLKESPVGISPLNGCWQAWKYKKAYEESLAIAVAQDANGFKVLYLPPQYLKADATEQDKAVFAEYQKIMANMHQAKQSGIILPLILDQSGQKMFEFDIKSVTGQKSYNTKEIIDHYNAEILTCLFADFLSLGSNGSGSFSLAETKVSVVEMAIESKLMEIKAQLNHDLVKQLFELNGWSTDVMPYFDYGSVSKESLDEVGKFVQRVTAVGMMPKVPETVNWVMRQADIPYAVDEDKSSEELAQELSPVTTGAGEGMASGLPSGTGNNSGSSGDSSTSNNENASSFNVTYEVISETEDFVVAMVNGKSITFMREDWENFKEC